MVDALLSSPVVGQLHAPNPTSSVKDMEVALASGSTDIQKLDVKHAKASQQAAAGSRNFSRSTGKPMGRPSEPSGTRPCGRSRKQRAAQVMKRMRTTSAGTQPGPPASVFVALFFKKLFAWSPAIAKATMTQDNATVSKKSIDPDHQVAAPFATAPRRYPGIVMMGCKAALATAKAASSALKAAKIPCEERVGLDRAHGFQCFWASYVRAIHHLARVTWDKALK